MEESLRAILGRIPLSSQLQEDFAPFVERICENVNNYRMGKDNAEIVRKFAVHLLPIFKEEGKVVRLENVSKLKVCGDLHGDLASLIKFLAICDLGGDHIIFLGDYLDKGNYSLQVLLLVFLLKVALPGRVILLRGNHEAGGSAPLQDLYSFVFSTLGGYDIYEELFAFIPLVCLVNGSMLFLHGILPKVEDIGAFLLNIGEEEERYLLWGDLDLKKERRLSKMVKDDLQPHLRKVTTSLIDVFSALQGEGLSLLVRGHSWIEKGFHAIKCGSEEESNAYAGERAISIQPTPTAPFFVSLHTFSNSDGMVAACMAIDADKGTYDIFQLKDEDKGEKEEEAPGDDGIDDDALLRVIEEEEEEGEEA